MKLKLIGIAAVALALCVWAIHPAIAGGMGGGPMGGGMGGGGMGGGGCMGCGMGGGMGGGGMMGSAGMGNPSGTGGGGMGGSGMGSPGPNMGSPSGTSEPGQRPRRKAMGKRAHDLAQQVDADIATAKGGIRDVTAAEQLKAQGDSALGAGHYRIAVERYQAAQKSLKVGVTK